MFHSEIAIKWLSIPHQGGGRVTAPFLRPIYKEIGDSYLHFTCLEAKKNMNTLLTPGNFAREAFLSKICKCEFLFKGFFPYSFILVDFSFFLNG